MNLKKREMLFFIFSLISVSLIPTCRNLKEDKTVWDLPGELREGGETVELPNHGCTIKLVCEA